ncbi:MAG: glycogen synthase GlgA [Thermodesulfobacteriota bacterium]
MVESPRVWFLAPEATPFAKTGGLADVVGSLPGALKALGLDVSIGLPLYRVVRQEGFSVTPVLHGLDVPLGRGTLACNVWAGETAEGIPAYFFEREDLFDRPNLYGNSAGDYYDNLERFSFFCRAALVFARRAGLRMNVLHAHDWQTGLIPAYLKTLYREDAFFSDTACVFSIHNIGYQGLFPMEKFPLCGMPVSEAHPEGMEYWGQFSLLKAGIVYADALTTVSPRYSREIQGPEFGLGMDGILRKRSHVLQGILNGADYTLWDPLTDRHIVSNYRRGDMKGKQENKAHLLGETGLDPSLLDRPALAFISRLSAQKGGDLLLAVAEDLVKQGALLFVLGKGEEAYERGFRELGEGHRDRVAVRIDFDEPLSHRMLAGADMLLVPSRYEPCGLTQLYALRYGTVPVARATGGLDDTITPFDPVTGEGNGFKFSGYEPQAFLSSIRAALEVFDRPASWRRVIENGMAADFSWRSSAERYAELYRAVVRSA